MKTLKIINFIHSCLNLPKSYYNPLYKNKKLENLNNIEQKRNKLGRTFPSNRKKKTRKKIHNKEQENKNRKISIF